MEYAVALSAHHGWTFALGGTRPPEALPTLQTRLRAVTQAGSPGAAARRPRRRAAEQRGHLGHDFRTPLPLPPLPCPVNPHSCVPVSLASVSSAKGNESIPDMYGNDGYS